MSHHAGPDIYDNGDDSESVNDSELLARLRSSLVSDPVPANANASSSSAAHNQYTAAVAAGTTSAATAAGRNKKAMPAGAIQVRAKHHTSQHESTRMELKLKYNSFVLYIVAVYLFVLIYYCLVLFTTFL